MLASAEAFESSSLRSQAKLQVQVTGKTAAKMTKTGAKTSARVTGEPKAHMDMVNEMRAEMCAHQQFGVSDEYDECLEFMTGACNPGPDMLMNDSPGEITTGKGFCTDFFLNYQAHQPGGAGAGAGGPGPAPGTPAPAGAAGAGASGPGAVGESSGAVLPDDSPGEDADYPAAKDRAVAGTEEMEDAMEEVGELMRSRSSSADELKEDLAALNWYEDELQAKIDGLSDEEYCRQIEKESVLVGHETSAPEMAGMLADMRCEMHRYSAPFYSKLLTKKLDEVKAEQKEILLKIEARRQENRTKAVDEVAKPKAPEPKDEDGEDDDEDGLVSKSEKKAAAEEKEERRTRAPIGWYTWLVVVCVLSAIIGICFFWGRTDTPA